MGKAFLYLFRTLQINKLISLIYWACLTGDISVLWETFTLGSEIILLSISPALCGVAVEQKSLIEIPT